MEFGQKKIFMKLIYLISRVFWPGIFLIFCPTVVCISCVYFLGEWYFDCECERCRDPTELETFVSALICEVCEDDFLLPTEPLDYLSTWTCGTCDFSMTGT